MTRNCNSLAYVIRRFLFPTSMRVAVQGCCHGTLDAIYTHIRHMEQRNTYTVDLLLMCGDFQAVRNHGDLQCMAVPNKYKELGQFYKYYTREKTAPILTIVIGGNHEASNYMQELYHGGWLAPNIYFLGHAGCVRVNGVRIAGASGIYKSHDFRSGQYETLPYDNGSMRSIYHIREFNVRRLSLLSKPNVFLSHDWPLAITEYGDSQALVARKGYLRTEVRNKTLGSPPLMGLLQTLKPDWWFSAHMHTRFEARVVHESAQKIQDQGIGTATSTPGGGQDPNEITIDSDQEDLDSSAAINPKDEAKSKAVNTNENARESTTFADGPGLSAPLNPDEITLDDEIEDVVGSARLAPPPVSVVSETRFLALDKCLPRREFLEVIDIPAPTDGQTTDGASLTFDPEWLAITRAFNPWFSTRRHQIPFPVEQDARQLVQTELEWVRENIGAKFGGKAEEEWVISEFQQFAQTAPGGANFDAGREQPPWHVNPQTDALCQLLEMENKINQPHLNAMARRSQIS